MSGENVEGAAPVTPPPAEAPAAPAQTEVASSTPAAPEAAPAQSQSIIKKVLAKLGL